MPLDAVSVTERELLTGGGVRTSAFAKVIWAGLFCADLSTLYIFGTNAPISNAMTAMKMMPRIASSRYTVRGQYRPHIIAPH